MAAEDPGDRFGGFVPIIAMMAAGEIGDRTQLITIGLAAQSGAHSGFWVDELLANVSVGIVNAYLFHHLAGHVDLRKAHFVGSFLSFGLDTLLSIATGVSVWELMVSAVASGLLGVLP